MDAEIIGNNINIVEYIGQFIQLEQRGDEWWGLSCFTNEKTPSFSIRPATGDWYDYSSGKYGGIIQFVMYYYHCSYEDAVAKLCEYAGIDKGSFDKFQRPSAVSVCMRYAKSTRPTKEVHSTVLKDDVMQKYEVNPSKLQCWLDEGISPDVMNDYQVRYDSFANRIVYPIRAPNGQIVNIGGRTLDSEWKEKGLRKYNYYYKWGRLTTIFGLAENRKEIDMRHEIILFEGCKSVLKAVSWGFPNCGAILTSHLNQEQELLLVRLKYNVVFALDKDVNVYQDKRIQSLKSYVNVFTIKDRHGLLEPKDSPVDKGPEVFQQLYDERIRIR